MPRGLQQRVALVLPVANAVVVEGGRLVAEVLAAHDIGIERQAAAFIDVVAEPDSEVGPLLGDVAMRGVVAVGVVLTAGGREPGLRDRRVGSGCRPCAAHRAGVLADSETVEPLALLEAGDHMHAVAAAGGGELGAATRDLGEVVGGAHLPQHRYVVGGHAPADRERVGCQPCPQHHAVGIGSPEATPSVNGLPASSTGANVVVVAALVVVTAAGIVVGSVAGAAVLPTVVAEPVVESSLQAATTTAAAPASSTRREIG